MNKTLSRVLWIIAGVLLIVAGVYCFVSPETKSQGLFHQIQKEVTFCGLPHEAYA